MFFFLFFFQWVFVFEWVFGLQFSGFVFEGLSFRKTLTKLVMTTSVRFTGLLAQGKMNILFRFHRNLFLLNLIDHAFDLKRSVRDPRTHYAIDHLSSHGYNFEVF